MKSLFFLFFYLVITTNVSLIGSTQITPLISNTTKKTCLFHYWTVYIYNEIKDPITVHVQSGDDDLGNHTLATNDNQNWSFCEGVTFKTLFYAHFYWNSKIAFFDVYTEHISDTYCTEREYRKPGRCFWLVTEDGFYVGDHVRPYTKLHDW
ncbi:putative plant self-incompatibility S1 [Helianthus annuus]|nr:putative plant self-incompatibility S1 [Helianthus annuus]